MCDDIPLHVQQLLFDVAAVMSADVAPDPLRLCRQDPDEGCSRSSGAGVAGFNRKILRGQGNTHMTAWLSAALAIGPTLIYHLVRGI